MNPYNEFLINIYIPKIGHGILDHFERKVSVSRAGEFLDAFSDKHNGGIGSNHGQSVVKQMFKSTLQLNNLMTVDSGHDFGFDFLKIIVAQSSKSFGDNVQVSGNISLKV